MAVRALPLPVRLELLVEDHRRTWLRVAVVVGALAVGAYWAWSPRPPLTQLQALVAAGAVATLIRFPNIGLGVLILSAVFIPFGVGTGSRTEVNVAVILVGLLTALWVLRLFLLRQLRLVSSRTMRPLVALSVVALLAFLNGVQPWLVFAQTAPVSAQAGGLAIVLLSICAFMLTAHHVRSERILSRLTWILVLAGAVVAAERFGLARDATLGAAVRAVILGSMFWLSMVVLAFSQAMFNRRLLVPVRLGLAGLVLFYMVFAITQNRDWNSGWVPEVVAILAMLWIGAPRRAALVTAVCALVVLWQLPAIVDVLFVSNAKNQYDILTRTAAWSILGEIIKLDPILGIGFANYYYYTPLFPILGYAVQFNSHNNYIDILAQMGIVGMACFVWFWWEFGRLAWQLRKRVVPNGFSSAYVYGMLGAIPAVLLAAFMGDWVLPFVYNVGMVGFRASVMVWLFMGGLVAIEQFSRTPPQSSSERT
jgi:hypothetical protein